MKRPSRVTSIRDVARLAGVSVSTVSRVLSGAANVDPEKRRKVERAIKSTHYQPNLLARGLRSKSGSVIGLVVPTLVHETFASFVEHCERAAREHGYGLMVGNTRGDAALEGEFIEGLLRRHVDGVLFSRVSDRSGAFAVLERSRTPVVILDRALDREGVPVVVLDNVKAGELAAEHLVELGHREIAVITGPQDILLTRERTKGFAAALQRHGLALPPAHILEGDFKYDSGVQVARQLLALDLPVTAVWAQNDLMAVAAMNVLRAAGRRVPEDVSVLGLDDSSASRMSWPALSTLAQPFEEMSRKAVELVVAMRAGRKLPARKVVLSPSLTVRESTGPAPTTAARGRRKAT